MFTQQTTLLAASHPFVYKTKEFLFFFANHKVFTLWRCWVCNLRERKKTEDGLFFESVLEDYSYQLNPRQEILLKLYFILKMLLYYKQQTGTILTAYIYHPAFIFQ